MAITRERTGYVTGTSTSFDCGASSNDRLIVLFAADESKNIDLTGATVDGKAMTHVVTANNDDDATGSHTELWIITEEDLGASNGSVTVAIAGGDAGWGMRIHLYYGYTGDGTPSDYGVDDTSINTTTVSVSGIDNAIGDLIVMSACHGQTAAWSSVTSPLASATADGLGDPSSTVMETYDAVEENANSGKTYTATAASQFNRGSAIVAVFSNAAAGGTTLTVGDMALAGALDAVKLTQRHTLGVGAMDLAISLDAPALTQRHQLAVAAMDLAGSLDAVTLSQRHALTVADLASAVGLDAVVLAQRHGLTVADLASAVALDSPSLGGLTILTVADLASAVSLDGLTLAQVHSLVVSDLLSGISLDEPAITGSILLTVADLASAVTVDGVALTQAHLLAVDDLGLVTTLDNVGLSQAHLLAVRDLLSSIGLDAVSFATHTGAITIAFSASTVTLTFTAAGPGVSITASAPVITFTGA